MFGKKEGSPQQLEQATRDENAENYKKFVQYDGETLKVIRIPWNDRPERAWKIAEELKKQGFTVKAMSSQDDLKTLLVLEKI